MKTRIAQTMRFGQDGNTRNFEAYGWSIGEDGFTWTDGPAAGLILPAPDAPHGFFVEVFFWVDGGADRLGSQRIVLAANGRTVGKATAYGRMRLAFRVPRLPQGDGHLVINFRLPDAARPSHGNDGRLLGIAVMSLRIMPLLEAIPDSSARTCSIPLAADENAALELAERLTGMTAGDLAMQLESLGVNCEPGFFQRKCGVEPLGLLRFSGVVIHSLVMSIDDGFPELGDSAAIHPVPDEADLKDWIVYERKHLLRYHTWVGVDDATADEMRTRESKRLPFLKNKLLEDLQDGEKTFVHLDDRIVPDEEILALFLAIRRRGPGRLLYIGPAGSTHQPGSVEEICPGLMRGYFSRFSAAGIGQDLSLPDWLSVCTNAWLLTRPRSTA